MPSSNKVRKVTSENYPTDEGQEAPIQPQIALTTEKKPASFNVSAIGLQYVLVCSITIRISPPSF